MIANLEIYLSETEIWENIRLSYQMADNLNLNNNGSSEFCQAKYEMTQHHSYRFLFVYNEQSE